MNDKTSIDQRGQKVGTQTNIAGGVQEPVLSGHFEIQGDFIYNEATKIRLPLIRPLRVQHFTGRELELTSLLDRLQPGRAVTICGPGGMGKTALAAEAIWKLSPVSAPPERFPDGIIFHTFYHRPQAALALETFARAYGEDPRPSPYEAARRALAGRQALIILDGTEACDDLDTVLSVTASCGVLITTRKHSDAPADFCDLPPLPLDEAVQLLQAWAGTMASDEEICQSICGILGGLPLALFLAGRYMAHRRQFGCEYLAWLETPLAALDLGAKQHQSIPLLMKHSIDQVSHQARESLGIAGVLALKPFEPDIIASALERSVEETNRILGELVDYGILVRPKELYQVTHALVHAYARTQILPDETALASLADHYEAFILKQKDSGSAGYGLLDPQLEHILAVQSACVKADLWDEARGLTWSLDSYLDLQGHWVERRRSAESGLLAARAQEDRYDEASSLNLLGLAYADLGESRKAIEHFDQSLTILREIEDRQGEGALLGNLGIACRNLGETRKAIEYHDLALKISKEISDRRCEGANLGSLGMAYAAQSEMRKAIQHYERALIIAQEIGDRRNEGIWQGNLALAYADLGETHKAIEHYQQALAIAQEIGDRRGERIWLGNLGSAYADLGETQKAIEHYQHALAIAQEIGDRRGKGIWLGNLGNAYADLGETQKAIEHYQHALVIAQDIGDRRNEGAWLGNLGSAYANLGETRKAIEYYKQQLVIAREIEDRGGESIACWNLGLEYEKAGELERAADLMQVCVDYERKIGHPDAEKDAQRLGDILDRLKKR